MKFVTKFVIFGLVANLSAAPMLKKPFDTTQPDGSEVKVYLSGDEYYQHVTTESGATLTLHNDGWLYFAELNADSSKLIPTERYRGIDRPARSIAEVHLSKKAIQKKAAKARAAYCGGAERSSRAEIDWNQPKGDIIGLTILVDFPDKPKTADKSLIEDMVNGDNFTYNDNWGSVKQWYSHVSGGKLNYTQTIYGYYTAANNFFHYDNANLPNGLGAKELVTEALTHMNDQGFDFSQLNPVMEGGAPAVNLLFTGEAKYFTFGLWPHKGSINVQIGGRQFKSYQISSIGDDSIPDISIGTFVHENGHMICGYPDLYPYEYGVMENLYDYCTMGAGSIEYLGRRHDKRPVPFNPYLRYKSGWIDTMNNITGTMDSTITLSTSDIGNVQYMLKDNGTEGFFIDARIDTGLNENIGIRGLLIWSSNDFGDNMFSDADGKLLEIIDRDGDRIVDWDSSDYWINISGVALSGTTSPSNTDWKDGTSSEIDIRNISELVGGEITFDLGKGSTIGISTSSAVTSQWKISTAKLTQKGLKLSLTESKPLTVTLYNICGQVLFRDSKIWNSGVNLISTGSLSAGMYLLSVKEFNGAEKTIQMMLSK